MSAEDALRRIQQELAENPPVNVILASRPHGQDEDNLQRMNVGAELQRQFHGIARESVVGEIRVVEYEPGYKPDSGEIVWIDLEDAPTVRTAIERIQHFQDLVIFKNQDDFVDYLRFYALFARVGAKRSIALFRATSEKLELGRGRKIGAILRGGQYDTVQEKYYFLIEPSIAGQMGNTCLLRTSPISSEYSAITRSLRNVQKRRSQKSWNEYQSPMPMHSKRLARAKDVS